MDEKKKINRQMYLTNGQFVFESFKFKSTFEKIRDWWIRVTFRFRHHDFM